MKILLIILILSLGLMNCQSETRQDKRENAPKVYDDFKANNFKIIVIEGCEFYEHVRSNHYGLTKVDCDCKPKRK